MDELGDRLEDLGIEIGVEFLYYAELCETFWRIKSLESEILLVAGSSCSNCTLGLTGDKITLLFTKFHSFYYKIKHADTALLQKIFISDRNVC